VVAWSGQPTAPWQAKPSYGRAGSATQLVDFATRVAAAPSSLPKPGEWIVVKTEFADSSGGGGGFLFGPPDERKVDLTWYLAGGCAVASVPSVAASLPAARTVVGKLTIDPNGGTATRAIEIQVGPTPLGVRTDHIAVAEGKVGNLMNRWSPPGGLRLSGGCVLIPAMEEVVASCISAPRPSSAQLDARHAGGLEPSRRGYVVLMGRADRSARVRDEHNAAAHGRAGDLSRRRDRELVGAHA
jgi:hypothetical protein